MSMIAKSTLLEPNTETKQNKTKQNFNLEHLRNIHPQRLQELTSTFNGRNILMGELDSSLQESHLALPNLLESFCLPLQKHFTDFQVF